MKEGVTAKDQNISYLCLRHIPLCVVKKIDSIVLLFFISKVNELLVKGELRFINKLLFFINDIY